MYGEGMSTSKEEQVEKDTAMFMDLARQLSVGLRQGVPVGELQRACLEGVQELIGHLPSTSQVLLRMLVLEVIEVAKKEAGLGGRSQPLPS